MQTRRILLCVATETEGVSADWEIGNSAAVHLMTVEAAELAVVHVALHEIVALHPILVRGEVGVLEEVGGAGLGLFKLPVVGELPSGCEPYWPIEVSAFDRIV